ncbi:hypothetical protein SERLA73DRAFT_68610 [Serpula lacrymans var. lacrymans S7.3]|uniref:Uncharacterized protein n=1 Tax=Serpula lacrymans var. lacrymans (strain S7.3) TaxID=936435 RepID=F8PH60_SERL3|nr:hypothetical protein SERLA73DRAFT_68610 [Serpula lacrymans var. lacrymans S7.3]
MESIGPSIKCLHLQYPQQGSHDMKAVLRDEEGVMTPRLVFHFVFIPVLQLELDLFVQQSNSTCPWHNKNKVLPHRRPDNIFQQSERWNFTDFLVKVHMPYLQQVWEKYACPGHKVYDLVPPAFNAQASAFFAESRYLAVTNNTA